MKPIHYYVIAMIALVLWLLYRTRKTTAKADGTGGPAPVRADRLVCPQDWVEVNGVCRYRYAKWWNVKAPI